MSVHESSSGPRGGAIVFREVERTFGKFRALRDVSFTVPVGSLCGLLGPNGAGKTTTLRIAATDLAATAGSVQILGADPRGGSAVARQRLGYVPDAAGLYEELSLTEYLWFFAAFHGLPRGSREQAVATAIELAGVRSLASRRLAGLSKGERQRVLIARALVHDPELLVLDEPAEGLDPRGRVELRELLSLLHERGKTILISSHVLADLEEICTDIVLIDRGRTVFAGSRSRLLGEGPRRARVRVEVLGPIEPLRDFLGMHEGVSVVGVGGPDVEIEIPGDPAFARDLLSRLVAAGQPVVSFSRASESLEAVHLRLTEPGDGEA